MFSKILKDLFEKTRCVRHNIKSLKRFRLWYTRGLWTVTDGSVTMRFSHYPYLAFHDIEGYIPDDDWVPSSGMTVIDAGACRGEFSIYAALRVGPTGKVILMEPDPENIQLAIKNIKLNGDLGNIQIVQSALWKEPGKLSFASGDSDTSAVASLTDDGQVDRNTIEVDAESIASLVDLCSLNSIDIVKMDIEGAEIEVISGALSLPPSIRPRYCIASYHPVGGVKTADVLPELFKRMGYRSYEGNPRHLTTYAVPLT